MGEDTMKRKKTVAELPDEVICDEIITRLPIKNVVCFESVSKYWQSILSDHQFAKKHLTQSSTQNPNFHDCVIAKKSNKIFILSRYKEIYLLPSRNYQLIGSINGLVCLGNGLNLSLWNPAIYQSKEFTVPPSRDHMFNIGLGYDPANNNYKVVVLSADLRFASVYNSNLDSWSDIIVADNVFPKNALEKSTPKNALEKSTPTSSIVKDCPYWTCSRLSPDNMFILSLAVVKFDAGSNEFKLLPEFCSDLFASRKNHELGYKLVDMKDRVTLLVLDKSSAKCMVHIYSLDGEEGCCAWIKMSSVGPVNFHERWSPVSVLQGFKYGGEIVFCRRGFIFCYDYNKTSGTISCFDKETGAIKYLDGTAFTYDNYVSCFRYTPTVVFIQGMKSVHSTTQSRTPRSFRTPRRLISSLGKYSSA